MMLIPDVVVGADKNAGTYVLAGSLRERLAARHQEEVREPSGSRERHSCPLVIRYRCHLGGAVTKGA